MSQPPRRTLLVATAGHVDHGKTALVRALTGVDTDRLPEEKRRGLTIDLGFAYQDLADGSTLGFVDVPGHERFVRNMIAGVPAIDLALVVVAADDGPMPQTLEHVAILDLLGVTRGVVAITKIDAVEPGRVQEMMQAAAGVLAATSLAGAPCFPVCALTGEGVATLAAHLAEAAAEHAARPPGGAFRLAVDRAFTLPGAGLVVTGAAFSGRVAPGDRLRLVPGDVGARVRGLRAQDREATEGTAGMRLALNLAGGIERADVHRGQWLVAEDRASTTQRLDARVHLLASEARALRQDTPVHAHLGAASLTGRLALLEDRTLAPGENALAQVVLDQPTHAVHGDRFVLRDTSARRTLGGGVVIDSDGPGRGRAREPRLRLLRALEGASADDAYGAALELAPHGVEHEAFARNFYWTSAEASAVFERTPAAILHLGRRQVAISTDRAAALRENLLGVITRWHAAHPDEMGPDEPRVRESIQDREERRLAGAVIGSLVREGAIARSGRALRLPTHRPVLPPEDADLWERVGEHIHAEAPQPPVVHDLAGTLGLEPTDLDAFLRRCVARALLVRVAPNRYLHPDAVAGLAAVAKRLSAAAEDGLFDARTFKDSAGIGRNFTIQTLEHFDAVGLTRRLGDRRAYLAGPAADG